MPDGIEHLSIPQVSLAFVSAKVGVHRWSAPRSRVGDSDDQVLVSMALALHHVDEEFRAFARGEVQRR